MDSLNKIRRIIADSLAVPLESVQLGTTPENLAQWDSLHHFSILMEVEEAFGFKFSLQELTEMNSVESLLNAVQQRVSV